MKKVKMKGKTLFWIPGHGLPENQNWKEPKNGNPDQEVSHTRGLKMPKEKEKHIFR